MFSFLNTTFLLAAAAALIPLIIHLFSKRKVKTVEFSSVRHLKAMQKRQVRKLKIKQYLLLLLRMLIILLVVLAFARPTTESDTVGTHAAVTGIIVLDNSASMNRYVSDGLLYDIAVKRLNNLLEIFSENDELYFLTTSPIHNNSSPLKPLSAAALLERIKGTRLNDQKADFDKVLNLVEQITNQSTNLQKEIYFFTDRQRSSLPDTEFEKIEEAKFIFVSLPDETVDNCGLTSVTLGGQLILPGHDFKLKAQIKNYALTDNHDLIASLYLDNNRVAQTDLSVSADSEKEIVFTRSVSTTGYHQGYVELSDDKFQPDNRYYFSFYLPEKFNLLIIDGDNNGPIISLALTPSPDLNQNWSVKTATPENLTGVKFWEYDVIILSGAPQLNQSYITRLNSFLLRGKSLFVTYDINTDKDYFNRVYGPLTGITINQSARKDVTRSGYYALDNFDLNHPLFTPFNFADNKPPEIKFYSLPNISIDDSVKVLMNFSGSRPALVENRYQGGKVLTFCGPLHPAYSEMTINAFWVPFISRSAEYLAAGLSDYELKLKTGDIIRRDLPKSISLRSTFELIKPDSSYTAVIPRDNQGRLTVTVEQTDQAGIYKIIGNTRTLDLFAVNLPTVEGDLSPLEEQSFAAAIGADDFQVLPQQADILEVINQFRFGRELWPIFLWLAVLLFAVEIWLSKSVNENE